MKLSDYIADFLKNQGIRHVFTITGGASAHLIDSIAKTEGIDYICPQHEQAGAMAADAYSRVTGNLGAAIATSGPGATNMLTGVCCAYYDSVPVIYITGQVSTLKLKGDSGIRQLGFQESDIIDIFKPVTKYAVLVKDPLRIRYELEKAAYIARSGRLGPVLVDIPDNLQREDIDPEQLEPFIPEEGEAKTEDPDAKVMRSIELINRAERPVLLLGWGIKLAKAEEEARVLIERLGFPVLCTWAMMDLLPSDHPLSAGSFGSHGTRHANFAVQNADLILSIGSRLDTRNAGSPAFARGAKKIVVDIDSSELEKFERFKMDVDLPIHADAGYFMRALNSRIGEESLPDISDWKSRIAEWKERFPICLSEYYQQEEVNPYVFVKALSAASSEGDVLFADTGCCLAWIMQAFEFKKEQRIYSAFNNTPMGYALPASIGACFALDKGAVICATGDGGLQMNIQEMATVIRHNLPIKIFLFNNHGYSMIQQTQDQWLDSKYEASTVEGGLAFPDFIKVAEAYGYKCFNITRNSGMESTIKEALNTEGPVFCNVEIPSHHRVVPLVKFGRAIEDSEPLLDREEFFKNMIVEPYETSLESNED